jgi:hypothetical protein
MSFSEQRLAVRPPAWLAVARRLHRVSREFQRRMPMTPESMIAPREVEDAEGIDGSKHIQAGGLQAEDLQAEDLQAELFRSALREALDDGTSAVDAAAPGQLPAVQSFFA